MDNLSSKEQISSYLVDVKKTITSPPFEYQSWEIVPRPENIQCMAELGLTEKDQRSIILGLEVSDYCKGPVEDHDVKGELWVFGKIVKEREVYIKIKLACFDIIKKVRIISFHFANEALCFPYSSDV